MKQILARAAGLLGPSQMRQRLCLIASVSAAAAGSLVVPVAPAAGGGGSGVSGVSSSTPPTTGTQPPPVVGAGAAIRPFEGRGMWIWELPSSDGGNLSEIIAQAHTYGVSTLMIKSGDGTTMWSQFNQTLVGTLHAAHLRVCAWQYVYGNHPVFEARVGAEAARDGANCLVIDAEAQYQGKYVQAQTYIRTLRKLIGRRFPLALAGFPWVDYHPSFPYSVFLGLHGAQVNVPQMYWRAIGTSVKNVYAHTYEWNEIYQRPIAPLGQLYGSPPSQQIRQFRAISRYYKASGTSWWDWQSAGSAQWRAVAQPVGPIRGFVAQRAAVTVGPGSEGDWVVWAQEHLLTAGYKLTINGDYDSQTTTAVEDFQSAHGLPVSGSIDAQTWDALLHYRVANVSWVKRKGKLRATVTRAGSYLVPVPKSASLRERGDELAVAGGAGGRPRRGRQR